jgi:DNA-binding transcriptional LysR family regulator
MRSEPGSRLYASAIVGHERRVCALSADDPWARRRSMRMSEIPQRVLLIDSRTGTTTPDLWPPDARPEVHDNTRDIDDWLSLIAAGGVIGITPEGTMSQYRRDGVVFRPLRDAPLIIVRVAWRRHDPHPAAQGAVSLLTELYQGL